MQYKKIVIITILFLGLLLGQRIFFSPKIDNVSGKNQFKIALFVPATHPAMDEICDGLKNEIAQLSTQHYSFNEFNANGNKTLLRAQADEIVQGDYDLVFSIGATCSHTLYERAQKKESQIPLVFTAVDDPVGIGIIQSLDHPGGSTTGVISLPLYEEQIANLLKVKPAFKKLLLVYDPTHGSGLHQEKETIEALVKLHNREFQAVEIFNPNEVAQKVAPFLSGVDVVMILKDHTAVTGVDGLINLCNKYGVTLYVSDLNSGQKGAVLAFGLLEKDFGSKAAPLVRDILEKKVLPADLPVVCIKDLLLQINTKAIKNQGLVLSDDLLVQLKDSGVILV